MWGGCCMADTGSLHPHVWHQAAWQHCLGLQRRQRLPHALLLSGPQGIGKVAFATALAQYMLCQQQGPEGACGRCKSCQLFAAGTHPDLVRLEPETDAKTEKTSKVIKVDQIRELLDFAAKSAQMSGYRVVIVSPAHVLNVQAANALLKTLEEPGRDTLFLLLTDSPLLLLPTIRSRCQQLVLPMPSDAEAMAWLTPLAGSADAAALLLRLSRGAPLAALALLEGGWFSERENLVKDLLAVAEGRATGLAASGRWQRLAPEALVQALTSLLEDVTYIGLGQGVAVKSHDLLPIIQRIRTRASAAGCLRFLQSLTEKRRLLGANIQAQAIVDSIWLEWAETCRPA
jgi:DNA polymerase-3 subunit delta'